MTESEFDHTALPEWYRIERETEKTINRLGSVKELDYYLNNPDETIRRLAIIRLQKLSAKESAYVLKEVLDNPVETDENRYLAAWALKTVLSKKDSELFTGSKYFGKLNGDERYEELFPVITEDFYPSVRFDFSKSESFASLKLENEDVALERDVFFETSFDFRQWSSIFGSRLKKSIVSGLKAAGASVIAIPTLIGKGLSLAFKKLSQIHLNRKEIKVKGIKKVHTTKAIRKRDYAKEYGLPVNRETSHDYLELRKEMNKRSGLLSLAKKGGFQMLYFLFAPFRFIRKHKLALLCLVIATFMLLAYTEYGRAFTNKYIAFDMRNLPLKIVQKARQYTAVALAEFNRLTGIEEYKKNQQSGTGDLKEVSADTDENSVKDGAVYLVTAKKGLNMRKSADPGSERVGTGPLPYGSAVIYLSRSEKDTYGSIWYYIEAKDGRSGWVSARFLKEKKEG